MGVMFLDTETTGLLPCVHEPWEVGLIDQRGNEHRWLLPVDATRADPVALEVGGYHGRHPHGNGYIKQSDGPFDRGLTDRETFAYEFASLTHGQYLAGAVVSFDAELLARVLARTGRLRSWHYHLVDVEALAAGHLAAVGRQRMAAAEPGSAEHDHGRRLVEMAAPPWSSDDLSAAVGVPAARFDRHTALGDCRWARAIYRRVIGG